MAINYTWNVSTVDVKEIDGNADTVFNVHWRLTGTDDANDESASSNATHGAATQEWFPTPDILPTLHGIQPKALKALLPKRGLCGFDLCERRNNIYASSMPSRFLRSIRFIMPTQLLDDRSKRKSDRC